MHRRARWHLDQGSALRFVEPEGILRGFFFRGRNVGVDFYGVGDWRGFENVLERNCWDYTRSIVVLKDGAGI